MIKHSIYIVALFTVIWIILAESFTLLQAIIGTAVSIACVICFRVFFDMERISNVNHWRFFLYLFYLIGQIYIAGFGAIKLILKGAKVDIVTVKTNTDNDFFNVMLANSITLTPGTLSLETRNNSISVLWLRGLDDDLEDLENADEIIKGKLERQLLKAQK